MDRRAFLTALSGGLVMTPRRAMAQAAGKMARVGLVSLGTDSSVPGGWQPFADAMSGLGFVEGHNLEIKRAFAGGRAEELPRLLVLARGWTSSWSAESARRPRPDGPRPPSPS